MTPIPGSVHRYLRTASLKTASDAPEKVFRCQAFDDPAWNQFVEEWAPRVHSFIFHALGPYGREPLEEILPLDDASHAAWATASFNPGDGQIRISHVVQGNPGQTLEKLCHEMTHASLAQWPEGDPFYEEGFVDFSVWVMAHAPVWGEYREHMIHSAEYNIAQRRDRAMKDLSDWDRKRWAGGCFAMYAKGPFIIASLKAKKSEGDFSW